MDGGRKSCPFFIHCQGGIQIVSDPTAGGFLSRRLKDIGNAQ